LLGERPYGNYPITMEDGVATMKSNGKNGHISEKKKAEAEEAKVDEVTKITEEPVEEEGKGAKN
ncbi:MAG: hypothetical protein WD625_06215, partial [Balneolales bacterium]